MQTPRLAPALLKAAKSTPISRSGSEDNARAGAGLACRATGPAPAGLRPSARCCAGPAVMSVRFTLVDRQLKLFKCGLQSLQKIGSELLLEALPARVGAAAGEALPSNLKSQPVPASAFKSQNTRIIHSRIPPPHDGVLACLARTSRPHAVPLLPPPGPTPTHPPRCPARLCCAQSTPRCLPTCL